MTGDKIFDSWPEKYDRWFTTPLGAVIKKYEGDLVRELLQPSRGEKILDVGCGTGVFTVDMLAEGASVVGMDISLPMLEKAGRKAAGYPFVKVLGDMMSLPFADSSFDKVVSVTALEFVEDARGAVKEMFRVSKRGGCIVVATLNSLSPWAERRSVEAEQQKNSVFKKAIFRSPDDLRTLVPSSGVVKTAIHFTADHAPELADQLELQGQRHGLETGAFIAARWKKS